MVGIEDARLRGHDSGRGWGAKRVEATAVRVPGASSPTRLRELQLRLREHLLRLHELPLRPLEFLPCQWLCQFPVAESYSESSCCCRFGTTSPACRCSRLLGKSACWWRNTPCNPEWPSRRFRDTY